jgi:hypothetical protein
MSQARQTEIQEALLKLLTTVSEQLADAIELLETIAENTAQTET